MNRLDCYPVGHPVAIALAGMARALRTGADLLECLAAQAEVAGVAPYSAEFDDAAALAGTPYCRALDLYVDRDTKRRADLLGYEHAHFALVTA